MKLLSWDTSRDVLSVALLDEVGSVLDEEIVSSKNRYCELLLPSLASLLERCRIEIQDIDCFAAAIGPGSFTGIRIGLSTMKAFAFAYQKKVIGISTLEAMSLAGWGAFHSSYAELVCPLLDAGRNEFYTALYSYTPEGETKQWLGETVVSVPKLFEILRDYYYKAGFETPILIVGEKLENLDDSMIENKDVVRFVPDALVSNGARNVGLLALKAIQKKNPDHSIHFHPFYIRSPSTQQPLVQR